MFKTANPAVNIYIDILTQYSYPKRMNTSQNYNKTTGYPLFYLPIYVLHV